MAERLAVIEKAYVKHYYIWYLAASVFFCLLAPFIMGMDALNPGQTGQVLDYYFSLLGVILLVPVFLPEQNRDIRDLTAARKFPLWKLYLCRYVLELLILTAVNFLILTRLLSGECIFPFWTYFFSVMASGVFLGGLGIFCCGICNNLPASYMIPFLYYVCNFGGGSRYLLGPFYLFSLVQGNYTNKIYLGIAGVIFTAAGIMMWCKRRN